MKATMAAPIVFVVAGILMLFAGSAVASAEEGVASSVGNFIQNKWLAAGMILAGTLWFGYEEGYFPK